MPKPIATSRLPPARKTYMVGMDGSELSFKALRLAAALCDDMKDNVVVVHVSENADAKQLQSKCQDTLLGAGIQTRRQAFEVVERASDWGIADLLIYLANHIAKGTGVLVIGAAGKHGEETGLKSGPSGQPPMGSVAIKCQETCKVPVVIVKSTQSPITQPGVRRGQRPSRSGNPNGLKYAVCVDSTNLSRMAFDLSILMAKRQDSIHLLHIENTDKAVGQHSEMNEADLVRRMYDAECQKIVDVGSVKEAAVTVIHKTKS